MIVTGSLFQAIQALGSAKYKALDYAYGLSSTEEPHLGPDLEEVIDYMIITGSLSVSGNTSPRFSHI